MKHLISIYELRSSKTKGENESQYKTFEELNTRDDIYYATFSKLGETNIETLSVERKGCYDTTKFSGVEHFDNHLEEREPNSRYNCQITCRNNGYTMSFKVYRNAIYDITIAPWGVNLITTDSSLAEKFAECNGDYEKFMKSVKI